MNSFNQQLEAGPTLLGTVLRYRWAILAATLLMGGLVYGLSSLQPRSYTATTRLMLEDPASVGLLGSENVPSIDPERYIPQQANRVLSRAVLQRAANTVGTDLATLERNIAVESDLDLAQLDISATAPDGDGAATLANAVADAYEQVTRQQNVAQVDAATEVLQERIAQRRQQSEELERRVADDPDDIVAVSRLQTLQNEMLGLEIRASEIATNAAILGSGVQLREDALVSETPAAPKPVRDGLIAAVLAFGLATAAAYRRAGTTRRVEHRADPGEVLQVPLLGEVPRFRKFDREPGRLLPGSQASEAYEFVLSSIEFSLADINASSVLITSASPGDGKTSTALHLAIASARETPGVLVDGDVRARGLTSLLRADQHPGLVQVATGAANLDECIRRYRVSEQVQLAFVPAGQPPDDSVGLMRTREFKEAVEGIKAEARLVIFDSPPLLPVADATVLATQVDAIVLVVDSQTQVEELQKVRERLSFVSTPLIGYVYNRALTDRTTRYGYGYGKPTSTSTEVNGWRRRLAPRSGVPSAVGGNGSRDSDSR